MEQSSENIPEPKESFSWNDVEQFIQAEALQAMLDKLPEVSRKVFNLFAIDGYTHKEIAQMLGISSGTSKWHVSNARNLLQQSIEHFMAHSAVKINR